MNDLTYSVAWVALTLALVAIVGVIDIAHRVRQLERKQAQLHDLMNARAIMTADHFDAVERRLAGMPVAIGGTIYAGGMAFPGTITTVTSPTATITAGTVHAFEWYGQNQGPQP